MALCEGIPESTRGSDVLLQKVATDDEAYKDADPASLERFCKEVRSHDEEEDQGSWHLQPIWEMSWEEEP